MQMLFQGDLGKQTPEQVRKVFWASVTDVDEETRGFAEDLYRVATSRQVEIDALIEQHSQDACRGPEPAAGGDRGDAGVSQDAGGDRDQ
jgi:transcription termination factor NusB